MSQLLLSWRGNFCYSPSAHYQVCWTFLRSSWCWAVPDEMSSLPCHITNASSSLERVTEQKLAVSWSRSCCISHVFSFWIKPTPVRIPLALQSPALEMRVWGMRHFSSHFASFSSVNLWIWKSNSHYSNLLIYCLEGKSISKRFSCTSSWRHEGLSGSLNQKINGNIFDKFWLSLCSRIWVKNNTKAQCNLVHLFFGWNYWEFQQFCKIFRGVMKTFLSPVFLRLSYQNWLQV